MPISRLSKNDRKAIIKRLIDVSHTQTLERILSNEDVYLPLQRYLSDLPTEIYKQTLAEFVVLVLGDSVLKSSELRDELCAAIGIKLPKTWRPGSAAASEIVNQLQLPRSLSGMQQGASEPAVQQINPTLQLPPLLEYQAEVLDKAMELLNSELSVLLSVPTGGGKTRIGTAALKTWHDENHERVTSSLWVAHTEELCEQATQCIIDTWSQHNAKTPTTVFRAWGNKTRQFSHGEVFQEAEAPSAESSPHHYIVISTPKTSSNLLQNSYEGSLGYALSSLDFIVIDEAHRAAASTYRQLLSSFYKRSKYPKRILGLSATPIRATYASRPFEGTRQLAELFDELVEPIESLGTDESPILALQKQGVLSTLTVERLGESSSDPRALSEIVARKKRSAKLKRSLLFTETVADSKVIAALLVNLGIKAEHVSAQNSSADRAAIIDNLKHGDIEVLCNCELLTTGFDVPVIDSIFLARETKSMVLYKQIVGRGLRGPRFGGVKNCSLYLCGFDLPFEADPNTAEFARSIWSKNS